MDFSSDFFSIDDLVIFTYDNEITKMILEHEINNPEEGHLFISCHCNLFYYVPNIALLEIEQGQYEISRIDFLIRCKSIAPYTDYFELGVWIREIEEWNDSRSLVMTDYVKMCRMICRLKSLIDEMIKKHKKRLLTWTTHLLPSIKDSKYELLSVQTFLFYFIPTFYCSTLSKSHRKSISTRLSQL